MPLSEALTSSAGPASYVETETCRTEMRPMVDAMIANDTEGLSYDDFSARWRLIKDGADAAAVTCSTAVTEPLSEVTYEYATAALWWGDCEGEDCDTARIQRSLLAGNEAAGRVHEALEAMSP